MGRLHSQLKERLRKLEATPDSSEAMSDVPSPEPGHAKLWYQGRCVKVPRALLNEDDFFSVFNKSMFEALPEEEKAKLQQLLPGGDKEVVLEKLWDSESDYFRAMHPVRHFKNLLSNNYFSESEDKARRIESKIYLLELRNRLAEMQKYICKWHEFSMRVKDEDALFDEEHYNGVNNIWKNQVLSDPESIHNFNPNIFCKENSSSEDDEYEPELSESFEEGKYAISAKREKKDLKSREPSELDELLAGSRFQDLKCYKNQVTIAARGKEWIEYYRKQEAARYTNPTRPWIYYNEDSTMSIVAPVAKKPLTNCSKPREHSALKTQRPACITILCLTRDAASRLPNGIGTRADICELITDSQYLVLNTPENDISSIVSGALDRLHYESDPCVRYDTERKIWIYLHRKRTLEHSQWTSHNNAQPNSLEVCSLTREMLANSGESIVVIKLEEAKSGKRESPESDQDSNEERDSEDSATFKRHKK